MATDYNKILLDKGYTQAQIDAMRGVASSGGSKQDIVKAGQTQTTTTTPKTSTTNQTSGMNSMSQSVAQNNSRNAQVGTGDVVGIQQNQTKSTPTTTPGATGTPISQDTVAKSWDSLSATQQKNALSRNKALNDYITSRGLTVKKEETPVTTTKSTPKQTTTQTPKQQQWDYQDNSQARMDEMARNLNGFRQTNPELFQDESMFYNFFIDGKGRSQDQIDYLWNYYNNVKKFGKYDNMPASSLGDGLANGTIPQGYLDYVKAQDPQKYQEILSYKQDSEDRIKYESYLNDAASLAGFESEESYLPKYPDELSYAFETWQLVDEDENGVDDRLYVQPTDEERQDVDRINTINSRRMEIKNMQKNLLDDLVEQYPGVPKATLMGIVQDRTKDISREYDDLGVELVQLQGTVDYLQNERKAQMDAGQSTIDNLQKAYGMYYNYTPAGIISRTRAQYEASNITLDQADNGTEAEKQMAVEKALQGYYDKYGSIIQRSMGQTINDIIAYAKKNGVGLAQALQENFVEPLRAKPEFDTLSSGGSLGGTAKWSTFTTKDSKGNEITLQINQSTGDIRNLDGSEYNGKISTTTKGGASFTPVSYATMYEEGSKLEAEYPDGSTYKDGWCGQLMNLYLQRIGSDIRFGDDVSTKTKWITEDNPNATPAVGSIVVWDYSSNPNMSKVARDSGHVARVTKTYADGTFDVWEQNGNGKHQVGTRHITSRDYIAGFIDPAATKGVGGASGDDYTFEVQALSWIPIQLRNTNVEKEWYLDILSKMKDDGLNAYDAAMALIGFKITNQSEEAQELKSTILGAVQAAGDSDMFDSSSMQSMSQAINRGDYNSALTTLENKISNYLYSKKLTNYTPTYTKPVFETISDMNNEDLMLGWKSGTLEKMIKKGTNLQSSAATEMLSLSGALGSKLKALGYDEDALENMLPNLNDTRENYQKKLQVIEREIINSSNTWRRQYGLPDVTKGVLLGEDELYTIYQIDPSTQLYDIVKQQISSGNYNIG